MLILDRLKEQNGPFTSVEGIDEYLQSKLSDKEKQQRLRDEVTYARDTSVSIPRATPFFKIYDTTVTPRRCSPRWCLMKIYVFLTILLILTSFSLSQATYLYTNNGIR